MNIRFSAHGINTRHLTPTNSYIPRLYGLPKIHKENLPMRPVVSFSNTPLELLSKFVNNFLSTTLNYKPVYTVKNTLDLADIIKDCNFQLIIF